MAISLEDEHLAPEGEDVMAIDQSALVQRLLTAAEQSNFDECPGFFTEDAEYKIGNSEASIGFEAIRKGIQEIYASVGHTLRSMKHDMRNIWKVGGKIVLCQADVI